VSTGSNSFKIGIKINTHKGGISLISYDLRQNKEINSVELSDSASVFFDSEGDIYAQEGKTVHMVDK